MINPVELIGNARRRLARIAALRAGLYLVLPAATLAVIAAIFAPIGALTWERFGYVLSPALAADVRLGLIAGVFAILLAGAALAFRAYARANDFVGAAERVDTLVDGHQQVLTLATLADPERAEAVRSLRTQLFPVLWRHVIGLLGSFDVKRAFRFEVGAPLARSSILALGAVVMLGLAMLALVRPPTTAQTEAAALRKIARKLESTPSPYNKALAQKVLAAASSLENPKLPPEERLKQLADVMNELRKPPPAPPQTSARSGSGKSGGEGKSGKGKGTGNGTGEGAGKGKGPGAGPNEGAQKGKQQIAELRNEISKAQARIEMESKSGGKPEAKPSSAEQAGRAPKPGEKPNQKEQAQKLAEAHAPVTGKMQPKLPQPGPSAAKKNQKGAQGDTHLGQFPAPEKFQRFYKLGEHGPALAIKDARYVVFRLPSEISAGAGGKTVPDTSRPRATTPYVNIPLREQRLETAPEERQLIPPRYRDLIH